MLITLCCTHRQAVLHKDSNAGMGRQACTLKVVHISTTDTCGLEDASSPLYQTRRLCSYPPFSTMPNPQLANESET
eukprot:2160762-Amphidinium_carterae.2